MALFKMVAGEELLFLIIYFVVGYSHRGSDLYVIFLAILATAAMLLLVVMMLANRAEAAWLSVSLSPDAGADAVALASARAAADHKGIGSIASSWKRVALRAMLLLAVGLTAAASFLVVAIFQEGHPLRAAGRWPMVALLMLMLAIVHGFFAWVAVCKDYAIGAGGGGG